MPKTSTLVTQSGVDTTTSVAVPTGLSADGKAGWAISGIRALWVDGQACPAADWYLYADVCTETGAQTFGSDELIDRVAWGCQNTAGVAVLVPFEPVKEHYLNEPRVTVQPNIYCTLISAATAQANDVIFIVEYEVVKLSDLEVLRLLAGGA